MNVYHLFVSVCLTLNLSFPVVSSEVVSIICTSEIVAAFLVAQMLKTLPAMQETLVQSLHHEDTHSSILAWGIPRAEGPGGLQSMGSKRGEHD